MIAHPSPIAASCRVLVSKFPPWHWSGTTGRGYITTFTVSNSINPIQLHNVLSNPVELFEISSSPIADPVIPDPVVPVVEVNIPWCTIELTMSPQGTTSFSLLAKRSEAALRTKPVGVKAGMVGVVGQVL